MRTHPPAQRVAESRPHSRAAGFSLLEMIISLVLMTIVLGVVLKGIVEIQQRNFAENSKVDTVQETRDFVDQMVRDIHDVGYPPGKVLAGNPACGNNAGVSCGLISFSSTQVIYEGALDGTQTVYRVWVQLSAPPSGKCPCILQRGVVDKASALAGTLPTYFTEVNGVLNSGNGAGGATYAINMAGHGDYTAYGTADVFAAYDVNAAPVAACNTVTTCASIYSLQITANVAPNFMDPKTGMFPVYSITSKARLNNSNNP